VLSIGVGDQVYVLSQESAGELVRRLPRPPLEGGETVEGTLHGKLLDALHGGEPTELDRGELAVLGAVIEAWATELGVDAPDVQELRVAIANELR
jgi:hypothetical protein